MRGPKRVCKTLNYIIYLLNLVYVVIRCVSISALACFASIPVWFANSVVGLKICAKIAGIKRFNSVIKKKRRRMIKSEISKRK